MKTTPTNEVKQHIAEGINALRQLRDEIRLELHLAGMDARDAWKRLEPRLNEVEHAARSATDASKEAVTKLVKEYREFRDGLKEGQPN